jgi:hypothetical protein
MSSVGCWPKPSQLAVTVGKGALQLRPDKQHPPSDRVARSKVRQNIFITHLRFSESRRYRKVPPPFRPPQRAKMRRSLNEEAPANLLVIDRSSLNPAHRGQESGRAQVNQGVFVLLTVDFRTTRRGARNLS